MLVDAHVHLNDKQFSKDLDEVIGRAKKAGIVKILNNGLDSESNRESFSLLKYDIVDIALGIHPLYIDKFDDKMLEEEVEFIKRNKRKIVAIGEVGFDFLKGKNFAKQKKIFVMMIELARELKKPVIVHSRGAEEEVVRTLKRYDVKAVLHSFNGDLRLVEDYFYYSIPIVISNSKRYKKLVERVDVSKLLTETDSPYQGIGERNEPGNVVKIIEEIAKIKMLDRLEVEKLIFMNYRSLFFLF
jgi:TatD DNase family protein